MNQAELYQRSNTVQKRDALQCLEEYAKEIKWKNHGAAVIDIGCGDGSVTTTILKTFIPNNCKVLIGCDVSQKMVQFANAHHANDFISFQVYDIESDVPDKFREKFDHAFSFSALHWAKQQKIAFANIYDLLVKGGDCLLMFLGRNPVYEVFRELRRSTRWNYWMGDVERFLSPYHDCQEPEVNIKIMMTAIGFTSLKVKCSEKIFVFTGRQEFINAMSSINPYNIPLEMQEEYYENFIKVVRDIQLVEDVNNDQDEQFNVKMKYNLITVYGKK